MGKKGQLRVMLLLLLKQLLVASSATTVKTSPTSQQQFFLFYKTVHTVIKNTFKNNVVQDNQEEF